MMNLRGLWPEGEIVRRRPNCPPEARALEIADHHCGPIGADQEANGSKEYRAPEVVHQQISNQKQPTASSGRTRRIAMYIMIFLLTLGVFECSPVTECYDSMYSILLSESILTRHTPDLRKYLIAGLDFAALPAEPDLIHKDLLVWQLIRIDDKLLYYYPHGSSLLSSPLVAILRASGRSVVRPDGSYDEASEAQEQLVIAAFLMAALACVFLSTAEVVLPASWSKAVAVGASFGTQIWSTATRAMWSHTWEILLLGAVILELLSAEEKPRRMHMVWLASLVSWMFFVRPTGAIVVVGVTIYIFLYHRRDCLPYVLTGLAWLAGFIAYSWLTFGQILPGYYHDRSFQTSGHILMALAANLVSTVAGAVRIRARAALRGVHRNSILETVAPPKARRARDRRELRAHADFVRRREVVGRMGLRPTSVDGPDPMVRAAGDPVLALVP